MSDALARLGLDETMRARLQEHLAEGLVPGRVARVDRGQSLVITQDGPLRAEPSTRLLSSAQGAESLPAVGDWVAVRTADDMDLGLIEAVAKRTSAFMRGDPGEAVGAQVLAANIDIVFIVHALADDPNLSRIERELVLAWESGAKPVVVLNKVDLCDDPEAARMQVESVTPGVDVHLVSALDGRGMDELAAYVSGGATAALLGSSGVGKSTIVNRLVGEDVQEIADVRAGDRKGRHTTVARELIELPGGGLLVDTPGLRALALWDADEGIGQAFPEIVDIAAGCRFRDCSHRDEPGCAVKGAVEDGVLPARRFESYHRLAKELDYLASRKDARSRAEREKRWKHIRKSLDSHPKYRHRSD